MGLDGRPILTRPEDVWHHLLRLRAYGDERWARWQKAQTARQHESRHQTTHDRRRNPGSDAQPREGPSEQSITVLHISMPSSKGHLGHPRTYVRICPTRVHTDWWTAVGGPGRGACVGSGISKTKQPPPPLNQGQEKRAVKRKRDPPQNKALGNTAARVRNAHDVTDTEALAEVRGQLREGIGRSTFCRDERVAERALALTANPDSNDGLPLTNGVAMVQSTHTHTHTNIQIVVVVVVEDGIHTGPIALLPKGVSFRFVMDFVPMDLYNNGACVLRKVMLFFFFSTCRHTHTHTLRCTLRQANLSTQSYMGLPR